MNAAQLLRERVLSERTGTSGAAIAKIIREGQFVLSEQDLQALELRDEILGGWVFAYRFHQATPETQVAMLQENLRSGNPRVREQVCDLIGDRQVLHLREQLKVLFADSVPFVAEAARSNYAMLAV
jgi:hypothetical protein